MLVSVRDVADAVQLIADVVNNTRSIVAALNDGRKYLERNHPESKADWSSLMTEMQITIEGLSRVTQVVSGFRFGIGATGPTDADLARFNNYVMLQKKSVVELSGQTRTLKGSCDKVAELRDDLNARSEDKSWSSMWGLLGEKGRREAEELAFALGGFYADDLRLISTVQHMTTLATAAVADVEDALGPPGLAQAANIPVAAELLGVYATVFKGPQGQLDDLAMAMARAHTSLDGSGSG